MLEKYVQALSLASTLDDAMAVVKETARTLTGADGVTVVLRDGDECYYADEDAIGPLWKGRRFPMSACISGWVMENARPAVIEDIYKDPRIPQEAYRPTFVKSLAMAPIREEHPVGTIGAYWADMHRPSKQQIEALRALGAAASVAFENIRLQRELRKAGTGSAPDLAAENSDLKLFSYAVAHDLRAPLRAISGFASILSEEAQNGCDASVFNDYLPRISEAVDRMADRVEGLRRLVRLDNAPLHEERVDLACLAEATFRELLTTESERHVKFTVEPNLFAHGDPALLQLLLQNLLSNALKFTQNRTTAVIHVGNSRGPGDEDTVFFVQDNGIGFDMTDSQRMLQPFTRLHTQTSAAGLGLGMTTVKRIIDRHGGRLWWDSEPGNGAIFCFSLPPQVDRVDDPAADPRIPDDVN